MGFSFIDLAFAFSITNCHLRSTISSSGLYIIFWIMQIRKRKKKGLNNYLTWIISVRYFTLPRPSFSLVCCIHFRTNIFRKDANPAILLRAMGCRIIWCMCKTKKSTVLSLKLSRKQQWKPTLVSWSSYGISDIIKPIFLWKPNNAYETWKNWTLILNYKHPPVSKLKESGHPDSISFSIF